MLDHQIQFLKGFVRAPRTVGALGPSSRHLAKALCEPYRCHGEVATVLEVGAGTGAVTRYLGSILGEQDALDICEIRSDFADIIRRDVLNHDDFSGAIAAGRVRLLAQPVQEVAVENHYDFIISGLPLTAFDLNDVQSIFHVLRRSLKPGGIMSYFEYVGFRRTLRTFAVGSKRGRIRAVSRYLTRNIRNHQFAKRTVFQNFPPAHARYLRFD